MIELVVVCETDDCPAQGTTINRFEVADDLLEPTIEGFGQGSEDGTHDVCYQCGQLGTLDDSTLFASLA